MVTGIKNTKKTKSFLTLFGVLVLLIGYQNCGDNGKEGFSSRKPAPLILIKGLSADSVAKQTKTWNWSCNQSNGESLDCTYRFTVNQSDSHEFTNEPYGNETSYTKSDGTGTFWLHVQAKDETGVESSVKSISAKLDNTKPTVKGLSNDHITKMSKTWKWGCNDETSTSCTYQFAVTTTKNHTLNSSYGVTAQYTQHGGQGTYYLHVRAKDEAGNESEVKSVSVILDNTKPVITGLENDNVPTLSKSWHWACDKAPCTYRYAITGVSSHTFPPSQIYRTMNPPTVSKNDGSGVFWFHVQAKDGIGNESEVISVSAILDNTLPLVTGLSSDNTPRQAKTWNWGCSKPNCTYRFTVNKSPSHTFTATANYGSLHTKTVNTTNPGAGTWYLHVQAKDTMNNESAVVSVSVQLNDTPLTVTGLSSDPTPVKSKTWDWNCNEANCEYRSVVNQSKNHVFSSEPYSSQKRTTKNSVNGTWYLHVQARANNRESAVESVSVILDNTAPTLTGLENDQTVQPTKTWSWGCNETSPSNCEYRFKVNQSATYSFPSNDPYQSHPTTATKSSENGTWYLHVQAKDTAGNVSSVKSVSVALDNSGPQVTELTDDSTPVKSKTWTWSCNENPVTNCKYRFEVNSSSVYTFPESKTYKSQTEFTKSSGDGVYYLHVQAKDNADNESEVVSVSAVLDNTAPTLTGLTDDSTPVKSKIWNWSCSNNESCTYRHHIAKCEASPPADNDSCRTHTFTSESYGEIKTASQSGNGAYYIHVQAIDEAGNESQVTSVSTTLYTVVQVLADGPAGDHSCALFTNSIVKCWGRNDFGQLGQGDTNDRGDHYSEVTDLFPVNFGTKSDGTLYTAKAVSVGPYHSCAVLDDNSLKCWGLNFDGQLGLGNNGLQSNKSRSNDEPAMQKIGDEENEIQNTPAIDLGEGRTVLAVSAGGERYGTTGQGYRYRPNSSTGGYINRSHTCAILDNNSLKCWGNNKYGQLGQGNKIDLGDNSDEMGDYLVAINLGTKSDSTKHTAKAVSAGAYHTCAILDNNSVKCWGKNDDGQLGLDDNNDRGDEADEMGDHLTAVNLGTGRTAKAISAGAHHTCAMLDNNKVKCWGDNGYGQLGQGDSTDRGRYPASSRHSHQRYGMASLQPVNLGTGHTAKAISAGAYHTCAVLDNDKTKCWGYNSYGQLGQNNQIRYGAYSITHIYGMNNLPIIKTGGDDTVKAVITGSNHSCALLSSDGVKCWGHNFYGQLGLGNPNTYGIGTANRLMENLVEIPF